MTERETGTATTPSGFEELLAARPPVLVVNGRPTDPARPTVSAFDRGLLLGDGVFDTMRLASGMGFRTDAHVERLARSAAWLGVLDEREADRQVRAGLDLALELAAERGVRHGSIRTTITRGPGAPGLAPGRDAWPTVIVAVHPAAAPPGIPVPLTAIVTDTGRRNARSASAAHKTLGYVDALVALRDARWRGADDALFLDGDGRVACGTASNVLLVLRGSVVTPALDGGVLPGITRAATLEVARTLRVAVEERPVAAAELSEAEELWLTSSVRGIAPVVRIDGRTVGDGTPGALWRRVADAYEAVVAAECRA